MSPTLKKALARYRSLPRRTRLSLLAIAGAAAYGALIIGGGQYALSELQIEEMRVRGQLATIEGETARLRGDIAFVGENIGRYEDILARGMFSDRNRLGARRVIENLVRSNRLRAEIALRPEAARSPEAPALNGRFTVFDTPIEVQSGGILDRDLYLFMENMTKALPGFLVLHKAHLERVPDVKAEDLEALSSGLPVPLVRGEFLYGWRSAGTGAPATQEVQR